MNRVDLENLINLYWQEDDSLAIDKILELHKKALDKALTLGGVVHTLPSKNAVTSHLKKYASKEMTEYKPDELICFTSGALTLLRWLAEGKIK